MVMGHESLPIGELWMLLRDHKKLAKLMVIQEVSQRQLAAAAGYKSHAYMGRLLRGEVKSLEPEAALRIAEYLGMPVDDLFAIKVSRNPGRTGQKVAA